MYRKTCFFLLFKIHFIYIACIEMMFLSWNCHIHILIVNKRLKGSVNTI